MPDEQLINSLSDLIADHKWVAVASAVIGLLVRLSKRDIGWFPSLDARWRALAAVLLGVVSGVLDKVANGTPWRPALIGGLFSGMLAVASHDVIIEGFRKGVEVVRPPGEAPKPPSSGSGQDVIVPPVRESRRAPAQVLYPEHAVEVGADGGSVPSSFPKPSKVPPTFLVPALLLLGCHPGPPVVSAAEQAAACQLIVDQAFQAYVDDCKGAEKAINDSHQCKPGFSLRCPAVKP